MSEPKRVLGRNMYIVILEQVVHKAGGAHKFAQRCAAINLSSIWARLGEADHLDVNFSFTDYKDVLSELKTAGVETWGYHKPRCPDKKHAADEARAVCDWAQRYDLGGVILDSERENRLRFLGGEAEAVLYTSLVRKGLDALGKGLALSSHDRPSLHTDLPIPAFLKYVHDNCPQVYYHTDVPGRLNASVRDYSRIEPNNFKDRYKPTGNITVRSDVALPDARTCVQKAGEFIGLVKSHGFTAYSFWCWDEAPDEIFDYLQGEPVA